MTATQKDALRGEYKAQIMIQLDELDMTIEDIASGDIAGVDAALEIKQRVKALREILTQDKEFCPLCGKKTHKKGWKNPVAAKNFPPARRGGEIQKVEASVAGGCHIVEDWSAGTEVLSDSKVLTIQDFIDQLGTPFEGTLGWSATKADIKALKEAEYIK